MSTAATKAPQVTGVIPGAYPRCTSIRFGSRIRSYAKDIGCDSLVISSNLTFERLLMSYSLDWEPEGILVRFAGELAARDLIHSTRQLHSDPRFDEASYIVNDLSGITGDRLDDESLRELSALNYGAFVSQPNCRIVFVTTDADLASRLKAILMAPDMASYEITIQPTLTAARDWLDSQPQLHIMSSIMGFRMR